MMKKLLKIFEQEVPAAPPAPAQNFSQAFAAGRKAALAGGSKTFKWTDPKTGKEGTYGTELKKPAAPAAKPVPNPNQDIIDAGNRQRDAQQAALRGDQATDRFASSNPTNLNRPAAAPAPEPAADSGPLPTNNAAAAMASKSSSVPTAEPAAPAPAPTTNTATPTKVPDNVAPEVKSGSGSTWQSKGGAVTSRSADQIAADSKNPYASYQPQATKSYDSIGDFASAVGNKVKGMFGGGQSTTPVPASTNNAAAAMASKSAPTMEEELEEELNELMRLSGQPVQEKAPPSAKGERMVKHIKKGYAKDGKLTDKEKSIAYATAWKSHNKSKVSESVMLEAGNNLEHIVTRFKHETKNFLNGSDLDSDLYEALYDYYADAGEMPYGVAKARDGDPYQWVSDRFESDLAMLGHQRQFQETVMPVVDNTLSELARLAGLSESRVDECGDMDMGQQDSFNVSTNMSSDGTKSVNISAQGDRADALLQMLKMAGMRPHDNDNSMGMTEPEVIMIGSEPHHDEMMDEEYANSPEEEYETVDAITRQGNDLNREKRQYADQPKLGDNPMAEEVALDEELEALLNSVLVREEEPTWLQKQPSKSQDEIAKDWDARVKASKDYVIPAERGGIRGATNPPPDSQYPPGDKRNMMPPKRK